MWAGQFDKSYKIGQIKKLFFIVPYRNFYQGCGLPKVILEDTCLKCTFKKIFMENRQTFLPPISLNFA